MDAMAQVSEPKVEAIPGLDRAVKMRVEVTLLAHQSCAVTLRYHPHSSHCKHSEAIAGRPSEVNPQGTNSIGSRPSEVNPQRDLGSTRGHTEHQSLLPMLLVPAASHEHQCCVRTTHTFQHPFLPLLASTWTGTSYPHLTMCTKQYFTHSHLSRQVAMWTKPESELLPLTHKFDDAGPGTLHLLGAETKLGPLHAARRLRADLREAAACVCSHMAAVASV